MNNEKESTIDDVLLAINAFSTHVEKRFEKIEEQMVTKDTLKSELAKVKEQMVTKDYLDTKLSILHGDLVALTRKEDKKINAMVGVLGKKKILTDVDAKKILSMEPFVQTL